jgi:hypothetical protein
MDSEYTRNKDGEKISADGVPGPYRVQNAELSKILALWTVVELIRPM